MPINVTKSLSEQATQLLTSYIHDLNGLLRCIFENLGAARNEAFNPDGLKKYIDNARAATTRCHELSNLLLKLSNGYSIEKDYCNAKYLLSQTIQIVQPLIDTPILLHCPEDSYILHANEICISNVFMNLLLNAYRPKTFYGPIVVKCALKSTSNYIESNQNDLRIQISIECDIREASHETDNKCQHELRSNIFNEIRHSAMIHTVLELHNGEIAIEANTGGSFIVTIELPVIGYEMKFPY
jgi:hypothetical protein